MKVFNNSIEIIIDQREPHSDFDIIVVNHKTKTFKWYGVKCIDDVIDFLENDIEYSNISHTTYCGVFHYELNIPFNKLISERLSFPDIKRIHNNVLYFLTGIAYYTIECHDPEEGGNL